MSALEKFSTARRIVFGNGSLAGIAAEVHALGGSKVTIITDPGLVKTGLVDKLERLLTDAGIPFHRYADVEADPRYEIVYDAAQAVTGFGADVVIGFGGGSAQDIAKAAAVLARNEGPVERYFGIDLIPAPGASWGVAPETT